MTDAELNERLDQISRFHEAAVIAWPLLCAELDRMERHLTESLITQDNEQTRGRIKALREIKALPDTLLAEREGLTAGLAE